MGTLRRLWVVIKAQVNALIGRAEDPQKMIEQSLIDMHDQLAKTKERVAAAIADEKKLKEGFDRERGLAEEWEGRAMLGLKEGREDLAKQALLRQSEHMQNAQELNATWVQHEADTSALKDALRALYDRVDELKRRKNILIARQTRVEAQRQIQDTVSTISDQSAIATFQRMEEKIADMERQTTAAVELAGELSGGGLEEQFRALEQRGAADVRLLELKQKMGLLPDGTSRLKQLGASTTVDVVPEDAVVLDAKKDRA